MKVIIGLGNPGKKYENTRHNAGFVFLDRLRDYLGFDSFYNVPEWEIEKRFESEVCMVSGGVDRKILLAKPMTFMNSSGSPASKIMRAFNVSVSKDFILAHDDLDIELGKFKLQVGVSPKDHRGVISVENMTGKKDFLRIRIGVDDRSGDRSVPGDEYVLRKMTKESTEKLDGTILEAVKAIRTHTQF